MRAVGFGNFLSIVRYGLLPQGAGDNVEFRFGQRVRRLTVAAFAAVALCVVALPAGAQDVTAVRSVAAKRNTASFTLQQPSLPAAPGHANGGFLFFPGAGPQPGVNVGGRVPVGKSHVYVPYYGNVSNDPAHPGVEGTAGIAYGFRSWDISLLNGGFGTAQQALPGVDQPKNNPALSLSIRF